MKAGMREWGMQERLDAGQEMCTVQDRRCVGQRVCRRGGMTERRGAGEEQYRKVDEREAGMHERRKQEGKDAGKERLWKREVMDAGNERRRKGGMQERK